MIFSHLVADVFYALYEILYEIFIVVKKKTVTTLREIALAIFS